MTACKRIVEEALQMLEVGDVKRARTLLHDALKYEYGGFWTISSTLMKFKRYSKKGHLKSAIKNSSIGEMCQRYRREKSGKLLNWQSPITDENKIAIYNSEITAPDGLRYKCLDFINLFKNDEYKRMFIDDCNQILKRTR